MAARNDPRGQLARVLLGPAIARHVPDHRAAILRRDQQRRARQRRGHVALDVDHQHAVAARHRGQHEMQHGLRLARADAAPDQPVAGLAVPADGEAGQQFEAGAGLLDLGLGRLEEGARCGVAGQQPTPAQHAMRRPGEPHGEREYDRRQQCPDAGDDQRPVAPGECVRGLLRVEGRCATTPEIRAGPVGEVREQASAHALADIGRQIVARFARRATSRLADTS